MYTYIYYYYYFIIIITIIIVIIIIYTLYIIYDIETYFCRFFDLSSLGYIFGSFGDFCGALNVKEMGDSTPKKIGDIYTYMYTFPRLRQLLAID